MLNQVVIEGNLVRDPILRRTKDGTAVANFTIACNRDYNRELADYVDCVLWREEGLEFSKYAEKGRRVVVTGRLQGKVWTGRDGQKRTGMEINADSVRFIDGRKGRERPVTEEEPGPEDYPYIPSDDEIPF